MRRISTLFFVLLLAVFSTGAAYGQLTCSVINGNCFSNNTPVTLQNFDSPTFPSGYTISGYNLDPTGNGTYQLSTSNYNQATIITSYYSFTQSTINVAFKVSGQAPNPTSVTIGYTIQGQTQPTTCTTTVNVTGNMCIQLSGIPVNTPIRLWITFNGTGSTKFTFDDLQFSFATSAAALPVNFVNFQAKKVSSGMQLTWDVANEEQLNRYEVEKSTDGRNFATLGTISTLGQSTYNYTDAAPLSGTVYYRIRSVDNNGSYKYSTVLKFDNGRASVVLKVFPQPALSTIMIQHANALQGALITISSGDGKVVKTIIPSASAMQTSVDLSNLRAGMYLLRYNDGAGNVETTKIVKQ